MAARTPVLGYEVEVVARHVQALGVAWEAETHEAARDVPKFEGGLVLNDLC